MLRISKRSILYKALYTHGPFTVEASDSCKLVKQILLLPLIGISGIIFVTGFVALVVTSLACWLLSGFYLKGWIKALRKPGHELFSVATLPCWGIMDQAELSSYSVEPVRYIPGALSPIAFLFVPVVILPLVCAVFPTDRGISVTEQLLLVQGLAVAALSVILIGRRTVIYYNSSARSQVKHNSTPAMVVIGQLSGSIKKKTCILIEWQNDPSD